PGDVRRRDHDHRHADAFHDPSPRPTHSRSGGHEPGGSEKDAGHRDRAGRLTGKDTSLTVRIAHLSDLHFGRHDPAVVDSLAADLDSQAPDLVVVSGDFTQMGTRAEFTQARAFLDTLAAPVLAVPGNHDVPQINMIRRILDPYGLFRRFIAPEHEPFIVHGKLAN